MPRRARSAKSRKAARAKGFRSAFECSVAEGLTERGVEFDYEGEKLDYNILQTKRYIPDFTIRGNNVIIESKGRLTAADRKKMLLVKEQHPDRVICLLFQRDNTLYKGSKTRYSEWAEKNGFLWALKEVPDDWLK